MDRGQVQPTPEGGVAESPLFRFLDERTRGRDSETRRGDFTVERSWRHNPSSEGHSFGNDGQAGDREKSGRG